MWIDLKRIIPQAASRLKVKEGLEESEIFTQWDEQISGCFGQPFVKKSKPVSFKDKTLVVDCLNSSWACEFNLRQEKILTWLRKKIGRDKISKIRFIS